MIKRMRRFVPGTSSTFCVGKSRWRDERAAQEAVTRLRRENPGVFDSVVRPYRCPACKRWHLGHGA